MDKTVAIYHQARRIQQFLGRKPVIEGRLSLFNPSRIFWFLSHGRFPPPSPFSFVASREEGRGQWPGIKPGQSGEEGVKREHVGGGGRLGRMGSRISSGSRRQVFCNRFVWCGFASPPDQIEGPNLWYFAATPKTRERQRGNGGGWKKGRRKK